ncbi:MAG: Hsp20/alpha crystallin family protein [Candidatus Latescibacteria bacterium]|nr:Hsp20/alpha crystallin family protein [Candidatus Latescibacterota bacterium]
MTHLTTRPFNSLQHDLNRIFDNMLGEFQTGTRTESWAPMVDVAETPDAFIIKAELPGVTAEDVKINMQNNVLTLYGHKNHEEKQEDKNYYRVERSYGAFERSFNFPSVVDSERITADYKDGILTITLLKAEEAKPREIEIKAG